MYRFKSDLETISDLTNVITLCLFSSGGIINPLAMGMLALGQLTLTGCSVAEPILDMLQKPAITLHTLF